jgi:NAD(P)H-hydrate epimerase
LNLPVEIYCAEAVRRIDREAVDKAGIPGYELMQRAAQSALDAAIAAWPSARRWQVVCGGGNNGGDGYVLARLAAERGMQVAVTALSPADALRGDAATAYRDFVASGGSANPWNGSLDRHAEVLVDGIFGSGLDRAVEGRFADAIAAINRHTARVLALDLPSGLSADDGQVLGIAVCADLTVTFVGLKAGLYLGDGPAHAGRVTFASLDIPASCRALETPLMRRLDDAAIAAALLPRKAHAHKGDFGHVIVVGGSPGMAGAVRLCGEAALRSGAGRVTIVTHPGHCTAVHAGFPALMCHEVAVPAVAETLLERATAIAVGPGLGTGEWGHGLWQAVLSRQAPLVVDADALNLLATDPLRREDWVLTPHPGEAARLLRTTAKAVQADRLGALAALEERYGGTVVLKGAGTLVSASDGAPWLCTDGNPGMASAGMGDVLTGIVAGLLAQGLAAERAAAIAVVVHARAADVAAGRAPRGLVASDLMRPLRELVNPCV